MSKKGGSRSQSGSLLPSKDEAKEGLLVGEGTKKKRSSDPDHSDNDQKHKKRKCDDDLNTSKKKESHTADKDEKSHKTKRGKKKSRHHKKPASKAETSKSKDTTSSCSDKKHPPDSKHGSKETDKHDKSDTKSSSKVKSRTDSDKISKLAKIRAKFQGNQAINRRVTTTSAQSSNIKREDPEFSSNAKLPTHTKSQPVRKVRRIKKKRRMYIPTRTVNSSKFIRFKLLKRKHRQSETIRVVSPSLAKPLAVDPDLVDWIGISFDPDLELKEDVKTYIADDVTLRLRDILANAQDLLKHSGRQTLKSCDIDDALKSANFGRLFGPFLSFACTSNGKYYFENPDMGVHLGNEANKTLEAKQAGIPYLKQQWYQTEEMTSINNEYYTSICKCVFSQNERLATVALNNLKTTRKLNSQLVSQFCTFCFYTYIADQGQRGLVLIMTRILARNPCSALIEPNGGLKVLCTLLVSEMFKPASSKWKKQLKTEKPDLKTPTNIVNGTKEFKPLKPKPEPTHEFDSKLIENNKDDAFQFELAETLSTIIQSWKSSEYVILTQIEKCLNKDPNKVIPETALRVLCAHGVDVTKHLFWDKLGLVLTKSHNIETSIFPIRKPGIQDDEQLWISELQNASTAIQKVDVKPNGVEVGCDLNASNGIHDENSLESQEMVHPVEVDYDLKHRLLNAARFVYASSSFTPEWSKDITILLGDSLVPLFSHKGFNQHSSQLSTSLHTIYKGVQVRRILRKNDRVTQAIHENFDDYKYIAPRSISIKYGLRQMVTNKMNLYSTWENRTRTNSQIITTKFVNIDIRKSNPFRKPQKLQTCCSHSLLMSL